MLLEFLLKAKEDGYKYGFENCSDKSLEECGELLCSIPKIL